MLTTSSGKRAQPDAPSTPPPSQQQRTGGADSGNKISPNKPPLYPATKLAIAAMKHYDTSWRGSGDTQFKMQNPEIPQPHAPRIPAYRSDAISPAGHMIPVNRLAGPSY